MRTHHAAIALFLLAHDPVARGEPPPKDAPRLTGRVLARDGTPQAGVQLAAYSVRAFGLALSETPWPMDPDLPPPAAAGVTDRAGRFTMTVPAAGMYQLRLERPDLASLVVGEIAAAHDAPSVVVLVCPPESVSGQLLDEKGAPLKGLRVTGGIPLIRGENIPPALAARVGSITDSEGRFELDSLFLGEAPGLLMGGCMLSAQVDSNRRVVYWARGHLEGAPVVFVAKGSSSLVVKATAEAGGLPIVGGAVRATLVVAGPAEGCEVYHGVVGTTDAAGTCRFQDLPAGKVMAVEVVLPGVGGGAWYPEGANAHGLGPATVDVRVARGPTCTGTVMDEGGRPLAGAEVRTLLFRGATAAATKTDSAGRFRIVGVPDALAPGTGPPALAISVPGRSEQWPISEPKPTGVKDEYTVSIRMIPDGSVSGRVVDGKGAPVGGGELRIGSHRALVGEDGTFLLLDIPTTSELVIRTAHPDDAMHSWSLSRSKALGRGPGAAPERRGKLTVRVDPGKRTAGVEIVVGEPEEK